MKILAIETSCDETALALIDASNADNKTFVKVLSSTIHSQAKLHAAYGGVFPNLAKREHAKNLVPVTLHVLEASTENTPAIPPTQEVEEEIKKILEKEQGLFELFKAHIIPLSRPNIDRIAVTEGPGLEPALWVGISFAKALGKLWNVPVMPVNHMEGHIVGSLLDPASFKAAAPLLTITRPALAVLVSGGHTELVLVKDIGSYEIIGRTKDDAIGEAYDKVARLMNLGYPGGPEISKRAEAHRAKHPEHINQFNLPRPMQHSKDLDFSFSGLKTAVLYAFQKEENPSEEIRDVMSREFEEAAIESLLIKVEKALESTNAQTVIVGGGVAANIYLRKKLGELATKLGLTVLLPESEISGDNALMIGLAAYFKKEIPSEPIVARGNLKLS